MAKTGRMNAAELTTPELAWLHLRSTSPNDLATLKRRFGIRDEDLRDVPPPTQRPKIVVRDNYIFFILLFPYFDHARQEVLVSELDFFIGPTFLVTVNDSDRVPHINNLMNTCRRSPQARQALCGDTPAPLALHVLESLLSSLFPMLIHVSEDIDNAETALFDEHARHNEETISRLLRIKTNVTSFRRAVMGHKSVIERLSGETLTPQLAIDQATVRRLVDMSKEVWNLLENLRETVSALHDTHVSLLSFRTNQIMRTLTIFSVIVFPLTLFAAIFSMNTEHMPIVDHPYSFWIIIGLMAIGVIGMIAFFKEKRWL